MLLSCMQLANLCRTLQLHLAALLLPACYCLRLLLLLLLLLLGLLLLVHLWRSLLLELATFAALGCCLGHLPQLLLQEQHLLLQLAQQQTHCQRYG
jgi:hypothetical protein